MTIPTLQPTNRYTWTSIDQVTITPGERKQQAREEAERPPEPAAGTQLVQQFLNAAATDRQLHAARHRLHDTVLAWNPALHPRDGDGQFTDRVSAGDRVNVAGAFTVTGEFTSHELQALEDYTGPGAFADINHLLRTRQPLPEWGPRDVQTYLNMAVNIQQAIKKVSTTRDLTLYRGVDTDVVEGLQPGDSFNDKGFMSTSADRTTAARFSDGDGLLVLELPAGSHALNDASIASGNVGTDPSDENEVILPSDSTFTVTRREGNTVYLAAAPRTTTAHAGNQPAPGGNVMREFFDAASTDRRVRTARHRLHQQEGK